MEYNIKDFAGELESCLRKNILPFWIEKMQDGRGGFYGEMTGKGLLVKEAPKGAILNARILWSFSAAYRLFGNKEYLDMAERAKRYIIDNFYDKKNGGVFWSLNADGTPLDTKKQIYAIGFAIYGLSEFARATEDKEALDYAVKLYRDIEGHSHDKLKGGYLEAFTKEWDEIADMRLSDKDRNDCKTMNTHLHILEPYTNLLRVWRDPGLEKRVRDLLDIFINKILDKNTGHLRLFFDKDWNSTDYTVSYGHDIEASWLLHEAAMILGNRDILAAMEPWVKKIGKAAFEGFARGKGMIYEKHGDGSKDGERHWWVQAETVVGYFNLWQNFGDAEALRTSIDCWNFINHNIIDHEKGEWHWSIRTDGSVNLDDDKAGFWKCPYHDSRMCMEIIERTGKL
ncbi:MAG: AGE family epimerase/isomerase [Bacteroidales bacterium]|nr:AGE family epimerase/isomerase [Bacteroidales bacterium]MCI1785119.1 AGE family epimerase/isomerase [Bacteroidales bacterium]